MSSTKLLGDFIALTFLVTVGFSSPTVADTVRKDQVIVEGAWARASIGTSRPSAAYLTILNEGDKADVLTGLKTSVSEVAEVHEMTIANGVARMGPAGTVEIPGRNKVELKPGGLHIMLMKLHQPLREGTFFSLTLTFERAGALELTVPVLAIGASGPGE